MAMAEFRLNCQGLARRDPGLMKCIVPDPGWVTVSIDLAAGEPSVTSHFTQDRNYKYACFDGVGKRPDYENGILMIDDIYLMTMSVSPVGKEKMLQAWKQEWPAGSFTDQWMKDAEIIKTALKKDRQIHKILALGLSYGMGAKKMQKSMYDVGFNLYFKDAKAFFYAYWELFSGVRKFADRLTRLVETEKAIVNPFGYRLTPEPRKAFNAFIQSSVSGIMHVYTAKLMALAPYARFVTCIHDELLIDIPKDLIDQFRKDKEKATESLNEDLKWSVDIRTGFAPGATWYEAK
jgi:DNA polymerase I-like protein with 3'-5' exonuclease and polymerase domains